MNLTAAKARAEARVGGDEHFGGAGADSRARKVALDVPKESWAIGTFAPGVLTLTLSITFGHFADGFAVEQPAPAPPRRAEGMLVEGRSGDVLRDE